MAVLADEIDDAVDLVEASAHRQLPFRDVVLMAGCTGRVPRPATPCAERWQWTGHTTSELPGSLTTPFLRLMHEPVGKA